MPHVILVTGGSRSGKTDYAQKLAESLTGSRTYIATCPVIDAEMADRVKKHQAARSRAAWDTIEETVDLAGAIRNTGESDIFLVDCLTLWINNIMYEAEREGRNITEENITGLCSDILGSCRKCSGTVIFVTNEVGMGIIPDNYLSRRFRDLAGRCNQVIASEADEVWFMISGIPMKIKSSGEKNESFERNTEQNQTAGPGSPGKSTDPS